MDKNTNHDETEKRSSCYMRFSDNDTTEPKNDVIQEAIDTYGADAQLWMVVEEMSELTKEICKYKRGKDNTFECADEMADVYIMLEQLKRICNVPQELIQKRIDFKFNRLCERLSDDRNRA